METKNKVLNRDKIHIVMYHGSCQDGFGSAFIVWLYYKLIFGLERANEIEYIPCYYLKEGETLSEEYLERFRGKNVIMCDFSYKAPEMFKLINVVNQFMILDHHKTAQKELELISDELKIFDMKRSGVGITWPYFNDEKPIPKFLAHIQDRDLWTYSLENTHGFVAYFYEQEQNFELWETYLDDKVVSKAITTGIAWDEYKNNLIKSLVDKASYVIQKFGNKLIIVLYVNSPLFKSDVGNKLFNKLSFGDFSVIWDYDLYRDTTSCSLRSTDDRTDVSVIAKHFGGGGHRNASGLSFTGLVGCLPLDKADDQSLLDILNKGKIDVVDVSSPDTKLDPQTYTLYQVYGIKENWLKGEYLDLIKRKNPKSNYIVFQRPSDKVSYDSVNQCVIPMNEYVVIFNEEAVTDKEQQLQLKVSGCSEYHLTFTSEKDFASAIKLLFNQKTKDEKMEDVDDMKENKMSNGYDDEEDDIEDDEYYDDSEDF
jgi:uncharacterized protein